MQNHGYKDLAHLYDTVNRGKDYAAETRFLENLLRGAGTALDVGCGTGTHMHLLERAGFICTGLDLNQEMLDVAARKVRGNLHQGDMTQFNLHGRYGAVICMFAAFNHLMETSDAKAALGCFKEHLYSDGIVVIDLHNPQRSGVKRETIDGITRRMLWNYNPSTREERTHVIFEYDGRIVEDRHLMRIYTIKEMVNMLEETGFSNISVFDGYSRREATPRSKNLVIVGKT